MANIVSVKAHDTKRLGTVTRNTQYSCGDEEENCSCQMTP